LSRERGVESEPVLLDAVGERTAEVIVSQSKDWNTDLIVMGTHGRRGFHRLAMRFGLRSQRKEK